MIRTFASAVLAVGSLALAAGCAKKPVVHDVVHTTAAAMPVGNVRLSDDLARLCSVRFDNADRAPKFDYDEAALLPQDRELLVQVAKCVTEGALKGRSLSLVGRADPRGEPEYNMVLGENRADAIHVYLARLGVDTDRMAKTSRGELDAEGTDETTWQRDRRVDIRLEP